MCSRFPGCQQEMDDYLAIILNLALRFGANGFYEYHVHFASEAAARLQQFNEDTYWGSLDNEISCRIFAACAALPCSLCGAPSHPASSCSIPTRAKPHPSLCHPSAAAPPAPIPPQPALASFPTISGVNKKGRPIMHQGGRAICNNFNNAGCNISQCRFLHVFSFCGGGHVCPACPHNTTSQNPSKYLSTPIKIPALAAALRNHPDPAFVQFFIRGIQKGFHPGLSVSPLSSVECINQQSAMNDPEAVENLLAKEVREGFMIGLFTHPPFPTFCISPLGIATRKYSGKKRHHHRSLSSPW